VLGLTRQWTDPALYRPFRYGGACRPAPVTSVRAAEIGDAVGRLVSQTDLRGLNSADFVVRDDGFDLLEVNPRPGATLDVFADRGLFRWHLEACQGSLPDAAVVLPNGAAAATVYVRNGVCLPADFMWPAWTADRQPSGEFVPAGAPLCTVLADAADAVAAECLVRRRAAEILALAEGAT
jgi:predicted ATP-grasp superfamily ATP-dependent carboligase